MNELDQEILKNLEVNIKRIESYYKNINNPNFTEIRKDEKLTTSDQMTLVYF